MKAVIRLASRAGLQFPVMLRLLTKWRNWQTQRLPGSDRVVSADSVGNAGSIPALVTNFMKPWLSGLKLTQLDTCPTLQSGQYRRFESSRLHILP